MSEISDNSMDMAKVLMATAENESQSIHIESDILEASTQNFSPGSQSVFNIRRKGTIDKGSSLHITIKGTNANQRLTLSGGIFGCIERATLRSSKGVVICQSDKINHLASLRNRFVEQEVRERKSVYKNGCWEIYETAPDAVSGKKGKLRLKGDYTNNNGDKPIQYRLDGTEEITYSVSLAHLFPESVSNSIPVYIIDGNLQLVITWSAYKVRGVSATGDASAVDDSNHIEITKCIYVSDHIFFDGKTMSALANQANSAKGLVLPYNDFNINEFTLVAPPAPGVGIGTEKEYRTFMGLSNLSLKYILLQTQTGKAEEPNDLNQICGVFHSRGSWKGGSSNDRTGGDKLNLVINNKQHYPVDWDADNLLYSALEDVYDKAICLPRNLFTSTSAVVDELLSAQSVAVGQPALNLNAPSVNNTLADLTYFNVKQSESLLAGAHYMGVNLSTVSGPIPNTGKRCGMSPLEFKLIRYFSNGNSDDIILRAFCCVERVMVIKNGQVLVNYS